MNKVLDAEVYKCSHTHRMAYIEGKLDMCEEIKELAHIILARNQVSPFKPTTDFEEGQVAALSAIIESIMALEETTETQESKDVLYDA